MFSILHEDNKFFIIARFEYENGKCRSYVLDSYDHIENAETAIEKYNDRFEQYD